MKIGAYRLNGVVEAEIRSSWDELTDTATLTFPRRFEWADKSLFSGRSPVLKRTDTVEIQLGYDDENETVFSGYVSGIMTDIPALIHCQDAAWLLKQTTLAKSYKEVELTELLTAILPSPLTFDAPAVRLGPFRISNATPAKVLEHLKEKYTLKSWFRGGKLYCGLAYVPSLQTTHVIRFERNVVDHSLEYLRKEDVKIKLKAISMKPDNSKIEYETGDSEGEQRTIHFYDVNEADLKQLANEEINRMRFEGYRGSLTTFLRPRIQHGDVIDLRSATYPERDGRYLVRAVTTTYGRGGGRQIIELDSKV